MQPSEDRQRSADVLRSLVKRVCVLYGVTKLINPYSDSLVCLYVIVMSGNEPAGLHSITAHVSAVLDLPYHEKWDAVQVAPQDKEPIIWLAEKLNAVLGVAGHLRGVEL